MTRFFVVRHGNTFESGEPSRRIGVNTDLPLVEEGRDQARKLGKYFEQQGIIFTQVLCGQLQRTLLTAQIILQSQSISPAPEPTAWLTEIDHGVDENQEEAKLRARLGQALDEWNLRGVPPVGWTVDVEWRIAAWKHLFASPAEGNVLLVTSNGAARFARLAVGERLRDRTLHLRTGALGVIERDSHGELNFTCWDHRPTDYDFR